VRADFFRFGHLVLSGLVALLVASVNVPALAREENGTIFQAKSATIYYEVRVRLGYTADHCERRPGIRSHL
jgi:hypothetical protein